MSADFIGPDPHDHQAEELEDAAEVLGVAPTAANGEAKAKRKRKPCDAGIYVWSDLLIWGRDGPRDCIANVALVLRSDPAFAGKVFYDEMRERAVVLSLPWHATNRPRDVVEVDDLNLAEWCQLRGLPAKPTTVAAGLQLVASEHRINPLRDRLEGLAWDGEPRLVGWLTKYLGVKEEPYSKAVGRAWMISAVARVYEPGCQVDHTPILEGTQGCGKSSACRILAMEDDWFTDELDKLGSKDSAQDLAGKWIVELSELSSMRTSQIDSVKGYISRRFSHYRPSYGKRSEDFARRSVFIGTTNSTEYLADQTGNRRFWPIRVVSVDLGGLRRDVEQLWAEAVSEYHRGAPWHLADAAEQVAAAAEQDERTQADPWHDEVLQAARRVHNGGNLVTTNAVLEELRIPMERRGRADETRVGQILRDALWARVSNRHGTIPRRHYVPPPQSEPT